MVSGDFFKVVDMPRELPRINKIVEIRSLASGGHWRDGRFWSNSWVEVDTDSLSSLIVEDPRIEIREVEVEEYPEEVD